MKKRVEVEGAAEKNEKWAAMFSEEKKRKRYEAVEGKEIKSKEGNRRTHKRRLLTEIKIKLLQRESQRVSRLWRHEEYGVNKVRKDTNKYERQHETMRQNSI